MSLSRYYDITFIVINTTDKTATSETTAISFSIIKARIVTY